MAQRSPPRIVKRFLKRHSVVLAVSAWLVALIYAFPAIWMLFTAFKTEQQAIAIPPLLIFEPTLENFSIVQERSDYFGFFVNSVAVSFGSTLAAMLVAIPAAFVFAFHQREGGLYKNILLWMLSTKMLPAVGVLVPIYILFRDLELLDTRLGLGALLMLVNLPIVVWMTYVHFKEIPHQILEAAKIDGAGFLAEIFRIVVPLCRGGMASTALLTIILSWNEAFWSINLTASEAGTLTALIASYSSPEGLFWAKLSAASVMAILPIVCLGWFSQRQLVEGLSFGAVK